MCILESDLRMRGGGHNKLKTADEASGDAEEVRVRRRSRGIMIVYVCSQNF